MKKCKVRTIFKKSWPWYSLLTMNAITAWGSSWAWICSVLEASVFTRSFYSLCHWLTGFLVEMNLRRLSRFTWKIEQELHSANFRLDHGTFPPLIISVSVVLAEVSWASPLQDQGTWCLMVILTVFQGRTWKNYWHKRVVANGVLRTFFTFVH